MICISGRGGFDMKTELTKEKKEKNERKKYKEKQREGK